MSDRFLRYYRSKNLALTPEQAFPVIRADEIQGGRQSRATTRSPNPTALDLVELTGVQLSGGALGGDRPDHIVQIYTKIELLAHLENRPRGYINHTYWIPQEDDPLISTPRKQWNEHQQVPFIPLAKKKDTWVDLVINNVDELGHPFHLVSRYR